MSLALRPHPPTPPADPEWACPEVSHPESGEASSRAERRMAEQNCPFSPHLPRPHSPAQLTATSDSKGQGGTEATELPPSSAHARPPAPPVLAHAARGGGTALPTRSHSPRALVWAKSTGWELWSRPCPHLPLGPAQVSFLS